MKVLAALLITLFTFSSFSADFHGDTHIINVTKVQRKMIYMAGYVTYMNLEVENLDFKKDFYWPKGLLLWSDYTHLNHGGNRVAWVGKTIDGKDKLVIKIHSYEASAIYLKMGGRQYSVHP